MEEKKMEEILNNDNVIETEENESKTYTEEEVMKLLQQESDRRVSSALKKQQAKYEKQLSLSKLDGDERLKAEKDNRIAELEELVSQMNKERNKSELKSVLSSRGLSAEFADIITITDDIESSQANIDALDKLFKQAVKLEVEKRLASSGGSVKGNGNDSIDNMTEVEIKKLTLPQIRELKTTHPELYKKYFG